MCPFQPLVSTVIRVSLGFWLPAHTAIFKAMPVGSDVPVSSIVASTCLQLTVESHHTCGQVSLFFSLLLLKIFIYLFYLDALGLSCGMWGLVA